MIHKLDDQHKNAISIYQILSPQLLRKRLVLEETETGKYNIALRKQFNIRAALKEAVLRAVWGDGGTFNRSVKR